MHLANKNPGISKLENYGRIDGDYIYYNIYTDIGFLESLTLSDIVFIRDQLREFIEIAKTENKEGRLA